VGTAQFYLHFMTILDPHSVEMIHDLENPIYELIGRHTWWKKEQEKKQNAAPKRIVYYRDGVSGKKFFGRLLSFT
jgi:uncharacterized RmlC-like cupin family protein